MIEKETLDFQLYGSPKVKLYQINVPRRRRSPMQVVLTIDYKAKQRLFRRSFKGRKLLVHEFSEELRTSTFTYIGRLRNPKGSFGKSDAHVIKNALETIRGVVFGVSEKGREYLRLFLELETTQEVVFEERDLLNRSIYHERDLRDRCVREACLQLERKNSRMVRTKGEELKLESVQVDKKACDQCAICLENMKGSATRMCSNDHLFHGKCIVMWLAKNSSCPVCRSELSTSKVDQ
ncbi:hypothetical protein K2173_006410 [Erythroxylum novogranatense]|uniref:RING-type E3 ubiquitin transferase n=1 Tax=Erythroxylum novogranatense TaxID=1862640 RepID=A0AAV8U742_9ROSI|nr:hypothetical protein K2173_006410 [Erythroxylum novogranatense]